MGRVDGSGKFRFYVVGSGMKFIIFVVDKINVKVVQEHDIGSAVQSVELPDMEMLEIFGILYIFTKTNLYSFYDEGIEHKFVQV